LDLFIGRFFAARIIAADKKRDSNRIFFAARPMRKSPFLKKSARKTGIFSGPCRARNQLFCPGSIRAFIEPGMAPKLPKFPQ